jgi:hypothetical protein
MRLLEGLALLGLQHADEGVRVLRDAVTAADALLALADSNIAALQARALALSALAAATADPAQAGQAAQAFARAQAALSAAGVAEDTQRLFTTIASHDQSGVLAIIRTRRTRDGCHGRSRVVPRFGWPSPMGVACAALRAR